MGSSENLEMLTRLLQGMPLQHSLRAVLLAAFSLPQVILRRRHDAVGAQVVPRPLGLGTRLLPALREHGYQPYLLLAEGLLPDTEYDWEVPTMPNWRARTLPTAIPSTGLSMLVGSCYYDYFHRGTMVVGAAYEIAKRERVAFGMLVGDNLYLDVAPDQRAYSDAFKETAERYTQYFYRSPYHQLLSVCPSLTTWDDHEFWNNYPDSQIHLSRSWSWNAAEYDQAAQEAISIFQEPLNPPPIRPGSRCFTFDIPPLHVFVADTRSRRQKYQGAVSEMMPSADFNALLVWLTDPTLHGPRMLVLGQPFFVSTGGMFDRNPPDFTTQYQRLFRALGACPYDVMIVSGDVHYSRLIRQPVNSGSVYELISSPMCHIPTKSSLVDGIVGGRAVQDRAKVSRPPHGNTAWYFGTNAPQTLGLIRCHPLGHQVSVGAAFYDTNVAPAVPAPVQHPADPPATYKLQTSHCDGHALFTMRKRL